MTNRFWLFGGQNDDTWGGMREFRGAFSSPEEASEATTADMDWWEIVDITTSKVVERGGPRLQS